MTVTGADPGQLRTTASQFIQAADRLQSSMKGLNGFVSNAAIWRGPDSERFRSEWNGQSVFALNAAISALRSGADVLRRNADEQEDASRADGAGSAGGRSDTDAACYPQSPSGLNEMWKQLEDTPNGWDPFGPDMSGYRVQKVMVDGEEKYIVYIGGTVLAGSQNWGANVTAISGGLDDAQVKALQRLIPADAEVMLVGYSQGGLDAQNIAASGKFDVQQIVTFGSPVRNDLNIPAVHLQYGQDIVTSASAVNPGMWSNAAQDSNDNVEVFSAKPNPFTVFGIGEHVAGYGELSEQWDDAVSTDADTRAAGSAAGLKSFQGDVVDQVDIDDKGSGSW